MALGFRDFAILIVNGVFPFRMSLVTPCPLKGVLSIHIC